MAKTRNWLKADLALTAETLLCLSLFGPQPLAWLYLTQCLLPESTGVTWRTLAVLDATVTGIVVTFYLARKADEVRAQALARAGRVDQGDPLTLLVVLLAGALGAVAFAWFFFGGGYAPLH
jgi:hypothetical protein